VAQLLGGACAIVGVWRGCEHPLEQLAADIILASLPRRARRPERVLGGLDAAALIGFPGGLRVGHAPGMEEVPAGLVERVLRLRTSGEAPPQVELLLRGAIRVAQATEQDRGPA